MCSERVGEHQLAKLGGFPAVSEGGLSDLSEGVCWGGWEAMLYTSPYLTEALYV